MKTSAEKIKCPDACWRALAVLLALLYKSRERFQHNHSPTIINHSQILAAPALNVPRAGQCWSDCNPIGIMCVRRIVFVSKWTSFSLFLCSISVSAVVRCALLCMSRPVSLHPTNKPQVWNKYKTPHCSDDFH